MIKITDDMKDRINKAFDEKKYCVGQRRPAMATRISVSEAALMYSTTSISLLGSFIGYQQHQSRKQSSCLRALL